MMVDIAEPKEIANKAAAIESYAKLTKDPEMLKQAVLIRYEAWRNIGRIIREMRKRGELVDSSGGRKPKTVTAGVQFKSLDDLNITRRQSTNAQWLLGLPKREYNRRVDSIVAKLIRSLGAVFRQVLDEERKAALFAKAEIAPGLYVGDFRNLSPHIIADESVQLVFTDPPYDRDSIPLYEAAAKEAARILKPGGSMITYCGNVGLIEVATLMAKHLDYFWTCAILHSDKDNEIFRLGIKNGWKPLLWFVKANRGDVQTFVRDIISGGREKDHHTWQQAVPEAEHFIRPLTSEDGTVVDFFAGGGTTLAAAQNLGRKWIGFEIDPDAAAKIIERLKL